MKNVHMDFVAELYILVDNAILSYDTINYAELLAAWMAMLCSFVDNFFRAHDDRETMVLLDWQFGGMSHFEPLGPVEDVELQGDANLPPLGHLLTHVEDAPTPSRLPGR
eukprot:s995_g5.t1